MTADKAFVRKRHTAEHTKMPKVPLLLESNTNTFTEYHHKTIHNTGSDVDYISETVTSASTSSSSYSSRSLDLKSFDGNSRIYKMGKSRKKPKELIKSSRKIMQEMEVNKQNQCKIIMSELEEMETMALEQARQQRYRKTRCCVDTKAAMTEASKTTIAEGASEMHEFKKHDYLARVKKIMAKSRQYQREQNNLSAKEKTAVDADNAEEASIKADANKKHKKSKRTQYKIRVGTFEMKNEDKITKYIEAEKQKHAEQAFKPRKSEQLDEFQEENEIVYKRKTERSSADGHKCDKTYRKLRFGKEEINSEANEDWQNEQRAHEEKLLKLKQNEIMANKNLKYEKDNVRKAEKQEFLRKKQHDYDGKFLQTKLQVVTLAQVDSASCRKSRRAAEGTLAQAASDSSGRKLHRDAEAVRKVKKSKHVQQEPIAEDKSTEQKTEKKSKKYEESKKNNGYLDSVKATAASQQNTDNEIPNRKQQQHKPDAEKAIKIMNINQIEDLIIPINDGNTSSSAAETSAEPITVIRRSRRTKQKPKQTSTEDDEEGGGSSSLSTNDSLKSIDARVKMQKELSNVKASKSLTSSLESGYVSDRLDADSLSSMTMDKADKVSLMGQIAKSKHGEAQAQHIIVANEEEKYAKTLEANVSISGRVKKTDKFKNKMPMTKIIEQAEEYAPINEYKETSDEEKNYIKGGNIRKDNGYVSNTNKNITIASQISSKMKNNEIEYKEGEGGFKVDAADRQMKSNFYNFHIEDDLYEKQNAPAEPEVLQALVISDDDCSTDMEMPQQQQLKALVISSDDYCTDMEMQQQQLKALVLSSDDNSTDMEMQQQKQEQKEKCITIYSNTSYTFSSEESDTELGNHWHRAEANTRAVTNSDKVHATEVSARKSAKNSSKLTFNVASESSSFSNGESDMELGKILDKNKLKQKTNKNHNANTTMNTTAKSTNYFKPTEPLQRPMIMKTNGYAKDIPTAFGMMSQDYGSDAEFYEQIRQASDAESNADRNEYQQNFVIPPLDITTSDDYQTFSESDNVSLRSKHATATTSTASGLTYTKTNNTLTLHDRNGLSYEQWLERKQQIELAKKEREKAELERKKQEEQARKRYSNEQYEKWLARKKQLLVERENAKSTNKRTQMSKSAAEREELLKEKEKQAKVDEWKRRKALEAERLKRLKQQEEELRKRQEQKRAEASKNAWFDWMQTVGQRQRPVPLNQGMKSLRGARKIDFVQPKEWVNLIETSDAEERQKQEEEKKRIIKTYGVAKRRL